jgi:hypothetical protein
MSTNSFGRNERNERNINIYITCLETVPKEKNPGNASKSLRPSLNLAKIPKKNPAMMVRAT